MKSSTHTEPKQEDMSLTAVLYALSDETRLQIIERLAHEEEVACGYFPIEVPKSSLSHHFRVLRTSGVIATRPDGTALLNRLRRADLDARFPGLLDSVLSARVKHSARSALQSFKAPRSKSRGPSQPL